MKKRRDALYLDVTSDERLTLALITGGACSAARVPLPRGRHERVVPAVLAFLKGHGCSLDEVRELVVVAGPGRFSALRVAAVVSNVLAWAQGGALRLSTLRARPSDQALSVTERVLTHAARARRTRLVRPFYGRPPSITRPTKRR